MIRLITHPSLTRFLDYSILEERCNHSSYDIVIISDYLSQDFHQVHGGLLEAAKYRLFHPSCYILLTSFFSYNELLQHDTFGILPLPGTEFIRLPFMMTDFYKVIDKYANNELSIPQVSWIVFSTSACTAMLKEKIGLLKHGNKLDFVNEITGPLRAAAVSLSLFPNLLPIVNQQLQSLKRYLINEEIEEFFMLTKASESLSDNFLQSVSQFSNSLRHLSSYSLKEGSNIKQLISEIDLLNETLSNIINQ